MKPPNPIAGQEVKIQRRIEQQDLSFFSFYHVRNVNTPNCVLQRKLKGKCCNVETFLPVALASASSKSYLV